MGNDYDKKILTELLNKKIPLDLRLKVGAQALRTRGSAYLLPWLFTPLSQDLVRFCSLGEVHSLTVFLYKTPGLRG